MKTKLLLFLSLFFIGTIYLRGQVLMGPTQCKPSKSYAYSVVGMDIAKPISWTVVNGTLSSGSGLSTTVKWDENKTKGAISAIGYSTALKSYMTVSFAVNISQFTGDGEIPPSLGVDKHTICNNETVTCSLQNIPSGSSVIWSASNNLALMSGQGSQTATFRGLGNGTGSVSVMVSKNGESITLSNSNIWVGLPETPQIVATYNPSTGDSFEILYDGFKFLTSTAYSFIPKSWPVSSTAQSWALTGAPNVATVLNTPYTGEFHIQTGSAKTPSFGIRLTFTNACGSSIVENRGSIVANSLRNSISSQNQELNISVDKDVVKFVKVYNLSGILVYSGNVENQVFDIYSLGLNKNSIYIVEKITSDGKVNREKVIIRNR